MTKKNYQIPLSRDTDFEGDPTEGRLVVAQLMLSAINSYRLAPFGDYSLVRDNPFDKHRRNSCGTFHVIRI
jgi:hypothetical protein